MFKSNLDKIFVCVLQHTNRHFAPLQRFLPLWTEFVYPVSPYWYRIETFGTIRRWHSFCAVTLAARWFWLCDYHALQHISVGFFSLQVYWQPWPGLPGGDGSTNTHLPVQERSSHLRDVQVSQEVFQLFYKLPNTSLVGLNVLTLHKSPGPLWTRASVPSVEER